MNTISEFKLNNSYQSGINLIDTWLKYIPIFQLLTNQVTI